METAIRIIKTTMNDEPFWSRVHENSEINEARKTVYEHITKLRDNDDSCETSSSASLSNRSIGTLLKLPLIFGMIQ